MNQLVMNFSVPSLQQICLKSMIDYEEIQEILYPEMNGDTDIMPLFNERLTPVECRHYEILAVTGQRTLTKCKEDLRSLLYRRPFNLDLVQMRKITLFNDLPDYSVKQFWVEAIVQEWERYVPTLLIFGVTWGKINISWKILNSLQDGCSDVWIFELIEEYSLALIEKEKNELWQINIGLVWLLENATIDK